jgi:hypothetical protein
MGPAEVEVVFADSSGIEIPIATYLRAHAKTTALIQVLRISSDPIVKYHLCWLFHLYPADSARQALLERCFDNDVEVRNAASSVSVERPVTRQAL